MRWITVQFKNGQLCILILVDSNVLTGSKFSFILLWTKVRHHLAEVKNREEREAQKKRRENMMLLMIAMEQKLSTTSVNYCRDLLENRSSNSKSM